MNNAGSRIVLLLVALFCLVAGWIIGSRAPSSSTDVPVRTVADYLHAVIEADRTFYTQHIVDRMESMLIVTASENWKEEHTLPLPVQFLRETAKDLRVDGSPFHYRLVSLWPLNPQNVPVSPGEHAALEQVVDNGEVVEREVLLDGKRYFQAIYPDRAVSRACVSCHNAHPESPKRDFKLNDVMGGLVIQVPLN